MGVGRSVRSQHIAVSEALALDDMVLGGFLNTEALLRVGDGEGSSAEAQAATGRGAARLAKSSKAAL